MKHTKQPSDAALHGLEALVQRLIDNDHVRVTRMEGKRGDRIVAKVMFDEEGFRQIDNDPEHAEAVLHIKRTSKSFVQSQNYGEFVYSISFKELKHEMPFHKPSHGAPHKRGDRLRNLLKDVPEIGEGIAKTGAAKNWTDAARKAGHDDGGHTRTRPNGGSKGRH